MTKQHRSDWFHEAKWGVFMHFLAPKTMNALPLEENVLAWNREVDSFDVAELAKQLHNVKARYCIFTLGQNSGHYCAPNRIYDQLVQQFPSKCSKRDLIADLAAALTVYDIRLIIYFTNNAPVADLEAFRMLNDTLGERNVEFQRNWENIIREWSLCWGKKIHGWWIDGCYFNDQMYLNQDEPNFHSFAAALRAGNSESILAFNPGVSYPPYTVDQEEDYTAGEVNEPQEIDSPGRWVEHAQFHYLAYLGQSWKQEPVRFNATEVIEYTRSITDYGGVVSWDTPHHNNGIIEPQAYAILKELGTAIDSVRQLPEKPPVRRLKFSLRFTVVPGENESGIAEGRCELTIWNPWDEAVADTVTVTVLPDDFARIKGTNVYSISLPAHGEKKLEFTVQQQKNLDAGDKALLCLQRVGDSRIFQYPFPVRTKMNISRLAADVAIENLAQAMIEFEPLPLINRGRALGAVRLAVVGKYLAVYGEILDSKKICTPMVWDGSCIELFGVAATDAPIHQLFLQPAAAVSNAKALMMQQEKNMPKGKFTYIAASCANYHTIDTASGYNASALIAIPEWLETATLPEEFYLDLVLTVSYEDGTFIRQALFDSDCPANGTDGYARMQIT